MHCACKYKIAILEMSVRYSIGSFSLDSPVHMCYLSAVCVENHVFTFADGGAPSATPSAVQGHWSKASAGDPAIWPTWHGEDPDR